MSILQINSEQRAKLKKKAQVAFEFVMLISVVFLAVLVFTAFVRENFSEVQSDTDYFKLKDLALSVKSEINLAGTLNDGYQRGFFVPYTVDGLEYNITKDNGYIRFYSNDAEYYIVVPPHEGNLTKGNNLITKEDGVIEVNP